MILRLMMPILPLVRVPNVYKLTKMAKITSAAIVEISGWGYFYYSYKNDAGLKHNAPQPIFSLGYSEKAGKGLALFQRYAFVFSP